MKRFYFLLAFLFILMTATYSGATDISIQSAVVNNWQNTSAPIYLKITNDPFTDSSGFFHPGAPSAYALIPVTVNTVSHTMTIPAVTLQSTLDSLDNQRARYQAFFIDSRGRTIQTWEGLDNFQLPSGIASLSGCSPQGTCATWTDIRIFNGRNLPSIDRYTYSDRVIELKLAQLFGQDLSAEFFIVKTPSSILDNEFALSTLSTGLLKVTTTTGNLTTAIAGTDYEPPFTVVSPITKSGSVVGINQSLLSIAYSQLTSVPSTFPPSAHNHTTADITSGIFSPSRLGSGTPTASNFLRGDGTYAVPVDTGEVNTITNIGGGGVGVYKQKTGVNFELRNINAATNKISVALDGTNNEVDIDVNQANLVIDWNQLTNVPSTFTPSAHIHSAADTTSGVFAVARLGSGTPTATNFLRGDGSWSTVAYGNLSGVPSTFAPSAHQSSHQSGGGDALSGNLDAIAKHSVSKNSGATVGSRRRINLIEGANTTLTIADDAANEEVDVTIASTGGGGGGSVIIKEVDGTPSVNPATTVEFLQSSGFVITDQTGGVARVDLAGVPYANLNLTGAIVNADISASAAIAYSKLNLSGSIVNADVNSSAAIAYSKLNLATSIVNADINASAAIAYSKLALSNSIVNADINSAAAIAYSKLNLGGSIVNADVNASAAIAVTKLAAVTANRVLLSDASGFITASSVTNTTLGFLDATSSIQTQLNGKQATGNYVTALTGDVTASGPGSVAATIANDAVTFAKFQNIATARLLGRTTASSGDVEEITAGTGLTLSGGSLSVTAGGIGGSDTQLLRNNAGQFGGISGVTSDGTNITAGSGNLRATSPRFITDIRDTNGNEFFVLTSTASAVNEVTFANAATGNNPSFTASGGDTNIGINIVPKGTGAVNIPLASSGIFTVGPSTYKLSFNPYSTDTTANNNSGAAPLLLEWTPQWASGSNRHTVGMFTRLLSSALSTAGAENDFFTAYNLKLGDSGAALTGKGVYCGYEANITTNQTSSDVVEAPHAFGATIVSTNSSGARGTSIVITQSTVAANIEGHNLNIVKNVAGGTQYAYFANSTGSQNATAAFSIASTASGNGKFTDGLALNGHSVTGITDMGFQTTAGVANDYSISGSATDTIRITGGGSSGGMIIYTDNTSGASSRIRIWDNPSQNTALVNLATVSNFFKGGNVASATTITPTGNVFHVTGTTTITGISTSGIDPGTEITIIFDGALQLTHNSSTFYIHGGANFTTSANDVMKFVYDGTKWYESGLVNN